MKIAATLLGLALVGLASVTQSHAATLGEALNATNLTWTSGGTASWVAQSTTTHDGLWAAQSGPISNSQETWIETTVTGPGSLSFWWKVSSESGYDYLEFYTNGVRAARISGEVNWQVQNCTLGWGTQVLHWRYMKDGSDNSGQDRGWVDQASFAPASGPPVIFVEPASRTNYSGTTATFSVVAGGSQPLSFQWRFNGPNLSNATNATLTLLNVTTNQAGNYSVVVSNQYSSVTSAVALLTVVNPDMLGEALNATNLTWTTGGDAAWFAESTSTHDGLWAAQSGTISYSGETWLETTVTGPGSLSFWWNKDTDIWEYDYLEFYINGVIQSSIWQWGWKVEKYTLYTGAQVLRWRFRKTPFSPSGQNPGWVDEVTFTPSQVVGQGRNNRGQTTIPSGLTNVVAIAAGGGHSLALTANGQVVGWGYDYSGQTTIPSGLSNVIAIAAGSRYSLALTADGQVVGYGADYSGQTTIPSGLSNVVAVAAGSDYSLALTAGGQVVGWGLNDYGQRTIPSGLSSVVAIAAGSYHSLALIADGRVVVWGDNRYNQRTIPSGLSNVVAIAAGGMHSLALTAGGQVVGWGYDNYGQTTIPSGLSNVIAIAAGSRYSLALTADGRAAVWGKYYNGTTWVQMIIPSGLSNVVAIAAGDDHSLTLTGDGTPAIIVQPASQSVIPGGRVTFRVGVVWAAGTPPLRCQWRKDGLPLADGGNVSGARSNALALANVQWADSGQYTAVITNAFGSVTSQVASLTVLGVPPHFLTQPQSQTVLLGTNVLFSMTVTGTPPLSFQWRWNGTNLADGNRISGARTSTLTMTNVQGQDAGFYTAVMSNPWGSVISAPALLRVLSVERLTLSVSNQTPARFDFTNAAWVEVTLTAPFPNPFIWYTLDGSPPSPSSTEYTGTFIVSNTVVVRALAINPVDFSSVEMAPAAINFWTAFHLLATATTGGMVSLEPAGGFYVSNTVVTLTALPEAGWEFLGWTGDASGTSSNLSLVMDRDKSVTAQFGLIPRFTLAVTTVGGGAVLGNTQSNYLRGTTVCLTAAPAAGWEFLSWTGDASGTSSNVCVVMDRNKSVTAQFGLIPRFTLTATTVGSGTVAGNTQSNYLRGTTVNLSAAPAPGWEFLSWSGDASGTSSNISVVMDTNKSVTAQFRQFLFTLTVTTVGGGAVSGNTQSNYSRGTAVNLTAEPTPGWYFQSWTGDAGGTSRNASVVMDRDKSVAARFAPLTLLAVTAGGGTIAANPASNYVQDSTVVLTAQPQSGWTFLNWMGAASGTNPQTSVTMDRPKEVQAVFGTTCYTTVVGQGVVVRNFGTGLVPFGAVVRLTAIPQPGYYFALWGNAANSLVNPLDFTVTNATPTVGAFFSALGANQVTLTVLEQGAGIVAREPQANAYTKGQVVRLTAQPFPRQTFLGWAGDANGTQNPLAVTLTTNQTITALFSHRLALGMQQWSGPTQQRGFLFQLAGDEGSTCLVQTSSNLTNWKPLTTLTISNGAVQFIDVAVTNHSPRFYRGVLR